MKRNLLLGTVVVCLLAVGCNRDKYDRAQSTTNEPLGPSANLVDDHKAASAGLPVPAQGSEVSAPFDISQVMDQVRFAFRPADGGDFSGGHDTYSARVGRDGVVRVTPFHYAPSDEPSPQRSARPGQRLTGKAGRFETVAIARGATDLAGRTPGDLATNKRGGLSLKRGAVREDLQNRAQGVEQSWHFDTKPAGDGDLVVRIAATGLTYRGETPGGLHFVDENSGLGLRYGHGTWIDADGNKTAVPARHQGGQIVLAVPRDLVDTSSYPAVLDPVIGPEIEMDVPVLGPPASYSTAKPAIAHGDGVSLIAWEQRNRILGARVATDGTVLDIEPIPIQTTYLMHGHLPAVAFDGNNFLVVWTISPAVNYDEIFAKRVSLSGEVIDDNPIRISTKTSSVGDPHVVFDGEAYFVVWHSYDKLVGRHVSPAGELLDESEITIADVWVNNEYRERLSSLAFNGAEYFFLSDRSMMSTTDQLWGVFFDKQGVPIGNEPLLLGDANGRQSSPRVASDGYNFFAVWWDDRSGNSELRGSLVTPNGFIESDGHVILDSSAVPDSWLLSTTPPQLSFDGHNYVLLWTSRTKVEYPEQLFSAQSEVHRTLLTTVGYPVAESTKTLLSDLSLFLDGQLLFDGDKCGSTWVSGVEQTVYAARIDSEGEIVAPGRIRPIVIPSNQLSPVVSYCQGTYLVAWLDARGDEWYEIWGARVDQTGQLLDGAGYRLSDPGAKPTELALTASDDQFLLVWQDKEGLQTSIRGGLIPASGVFVPDSDFFIADKTSPLRSALSAASDGANFLVTWQDDIGFSSYVRFHRALVENTGAVHVSEGPEFSGGFIDELYTEGVYPENNLEYNGVDYVIATTSASSNSIFTRRIAPNGALVDSLWLSSYFTENEIVRLDTSFDGQNLLLVWVEDKNTAYSYGNLTVRGARIDADLRRIEQTPFDIVTCEESCHIEGIVFDGTNHLLGVEKQFSPNLAITSFSPEGTVLNQVPSFLATQNPGEVSMASSLDGRSLIVYTFNPDVIFKPVHSFRVRAQLVHSTHSELGQPCSGQSDCPVGYCVDGVCCNTECGGGDATDCQACSVARGASQDGRCELLDQAHTCRAAAGLCDRPETCYGNSSTCPEDDYEGRWVECRPAVGLCDIAEDCTGDSPSCPKDAFKGDHIKCRVKVGVCDVADYCSGEEAKCPADAKSRDECRPADGDCDVSEICDGVNNDCPQDVHAPAATVCRSANGDCDVAEVCDGVNNDCPQDVYAPAATVCRSANGDCDVAEVCDGVSNGCPQDVYAPAATVCRSAEGDCDVAEVCDGVSDGCPQDVYAPAATVCRSADGDCDVAEVCDGSSDLCPANVLLENGEQCDDLDVLTEDDACQAGGSCVGEPVVGTCGDPVVPSSFPYDESSSTADMPSAVSVYGDSCTAAAAEGADEIFKLELAADERLTVTVAPEAAFDVALFLVATCSDSQTCLASANLSAEGDAEQLTYETVQDETVYLIVESGAADQAGAYELEIAVSEVDAIDTASTTDTDTAIDTDGEDTGVDTELPLDTDTQLVPDTDSELDTADGPDSDTASDTWTDTDLGTDGGPDTDVPSDTGGGLDTDDDLGTGTDIDSDILGGNGDDVIDPLNRVDGACSCRAVGASRDPSRFSVWGLLAALLFAV